MRAQRKGAGGAVVTAGDVVFYGTMEGWFKALNARTGELLWQHKLSSGIIGQPTTYRGPDGRQYVAILAGVGGIVDINAFAGARGTWESWLAARAQR